MSLSDKKKAAIKAAIVALAAGFIGEYLEPIGKALDLLLSFF